MTGGRHIPGLDGLRGVAVLGVVVYHLGFLPGGYLGVDAFFVLSGFLITGLLIDEADGGRHPEAPGRIALGPFWVRRAKRLFPALLVVLATVVVVESWLLDGGLDGPTLRVETLSALAYVHNWQAIVNGVDYWAAYDAPSPLQHMWSLAIEEQFYVAWPLLVAGVVWWVSRRRASPAPGATARTVGVAAALGAATSAVIAQLVYDPTEQLRVYYGTDARIAAILFGAVAAAVVRLRPAVSVPGQRWIGRLALVLVVPIAWAWVALEGTSTVLYRGGLVATGLATTFVVVAVVVAPGSWIARASAWTPLRWCGLVSYGLYLWHWPVIVWISPERTGLGDGALALTRILCFTALTVASYLLVERPVRRSSPSGRRTLAFALPALTGVGVLALVATATTTSTATLADRPPAGARSTEPIPPPPSDPPSRVHGPGAVTAAAPGGETGAAGATTPPTRIMIVGDSGAYFMGPLLEAAAPHLEVLQRGVVGCGVATAGGGSWSESLGFLPDPEGCEDWPRRWSRDASRFRPDRVVILLGWPGIGDRELDGARRHPCDPVFDAYYAERLDLAVTSAGAGGGEVTLVTIPYPVADGGDDALAVERVDCLNRTIRAVAARSDARVVDLADWLCPTRVCRTVLDGHVLRPDGVHFEGPGGELVAAWIVDQLERVG